MSADELREKVREKIAAADAAEAAGDDNAAFANKLSALIYGYYLDAQVAYEQSLRTEFV